MDTYVERLVDLTSPEINELENFTVEEARSLILESPEHVGLLRGSFALVAKRGKSVRMVRSLDRPLRYFLAKRREGPALIVAQRIDQIFEWLRTERLDLQFHPSYTRMVPAHHLIELELIGCPDPDPVYTRFFSPPMDGLPADPEKIGEVYVGALLNSISGWLDRIPEREPIGVCFSGGIDSGSVFLATYHLMSKRSMNLSRLKAFVLNLGNGPDLDQARSFLQALGLELFLESIDVDAGEVDVLETIRTLEDYKALDVESGSMAIALCRGIRKRYPEWKYLIDGDGGDENLKDYPIEENPELTIRSVIHNSMLYQEGWGVGKIKHSLTYSGGLSRSYVRTYAPAHKFGFKGFSPYTRPEVIAIAEAIPFISLTSYSHERLYRLKGEIVEHGIRILTGFRMPVFHKRRFQHGAMQETALRAKLPLGESDYRKQFLSLYQ